MVNPVITMKTVQNNDSCEKHRMGVFEFLWTIFTFTIACVTIPSWFFCYFVVQCFRSAWLYVLSGCYQGSGLEFIHSASIRSLMDRHRNHGIITFLISVKGQCNPALIKRSLQDVIERRDKVGNLLYPRLQQTLETIWGCYAWRKRGTFNLEENLLIGPSTFRGRPLSENNLQEYVSAIVAKYLLPDFPPWQIVLIPNIVGIEDTHYFLVRIHHILLSEEKNLRISDLLMIKQTPTSDLTNTGVDHISESLKGKHPLLHLFETPTAIPELYAKINENCSNRWNEFVAQYDPIENPQLLKTTPTLYPFFSTILITLISVIREYRKDFWRISADPQSKIKYFCSILNRETEKRELTIKSLLKSILVTIDPRNLFLKSVHFFWWVTIACTLKMPILAYYEIRTFFDCLTLNYCTHSNTIVGFIFNYIPLCYKACKEILYCIRVVVEAPKNITNDIIFTNIFEPVQAIKLCGRKVVSWTQKLDANMIRKLANDAGVTDTEIVLSATGVAISEFFKDAGLPIPERIPITARNINRNYIFASQLQKKTVRQDIGGVICLNLPLVKSQKDFTAGHENLMKLHANLEKVRNSQPFLYLLSQMQTKHELITKSLPSVVIKIILNYLSTIYTVALTEMTSCLDEQKYRSTVWGQEIENIIYWKPPQANLSLSLCISAYAGSITLAIMSDALLSPHHVTLGQEFTRYITKLAQEYNDKQETLM